MNKPARPLPPPGRVYVGVRRADGCEVGYVDPGGKMARLDLRLDLRNHSPTGFEWGYGGSGPAQLALALIADATADDELAVVTYQDFKFQIVAHLPAEQWQLQAANIASFARLLRRPLVLDAGGEN